MMPQIVVLAARTRARKASPKKKVVAIPKTLTIPQKAVMEKRKEKMARKIRKIVMEKQRRINLIQRVLKKKVQSMRKRKRVKTAWMRF